MPGLAEDQPPKCPRRWKALNSMFSSQNDRGVHRSTNSDRDTAHQPHERVHGLDNDLRRLHCIRHLRQDNKCLRQQLAQVALHLSSASEQAHRATTCPGCIEPVHSVSVENHQRKTAAGYPTCVPGSSIPTIIMPGVVENCALTMNLVQ